MSANTDFDPLKIDRPDPVLFRYYVFVSLLTGPLTPLVLAPLWFRFITLRYKFDDSGVSMRWGILFRKEVYLTYRRIQDIHLTRNILQRWMGLAKISLQTASGSSDAEMAIEGILEADALRDFLYSRMRGAKNDSAAGPQFELKSSTGVTANSARATKALEEIRDSLHLLVARQNAAKQDSASQDSGAAKTVGAKTVGAKTVGATCYDFSRRGRAPRQSVVLSRRLADDHPVVLCSR